MAYPNFVDLSLPDAEVYYQADFLPQTQASQLFEEHLQSLSWQTHSVKVFGKVYPQPRLTAFYGDQGLSYRYSNLELQATAWTPPLLDLKVAIERACNHRFNSALCNLYRDGQDSNGWHSDNELSLGQNPVIASLSLGQDRWFHLRSKHNKQQKHKILLTNGSLLLMKGVTQHTWQHQVPKTQKAVSPRINLTFRTILT